MAQADQTIQNASFPSVRTDINDNLAALFSQNSGNAAPAVTVAFMPWIDTSSSPAVWKVRNAANNGWITVGTIDATTFAVGGVSPIANGGTGQITAAAALTALLPSQTGNSGKSLTTDGTAASWGTITAITSGTAVASTSGTNIDFTGIPSWVKRVTVMFDDVSTNGSSIVQIQLGSGSFSTSGYKSTASYGDSSVNAYAQATSGFIIDTSYASASLTRSGFYTFVLLGSNTWVGSGGVGGDATGLVTFACAGKSPALSGTLDRIRVTTVNGTDTFDAGSINILYEG